MHVLHSDPPPLTTPSLIEIECKVHRFVPKAICCTHIIAGTAARHVRLKPGIDDLGGLICRPCYESTNEDLSHLRMVCILCLRVIALPYVGKPAKEQEATEEPEPTEYRKPVRKRRGRRPEGQRSRRRARPDLG